MRVRETPRQRDGHSAIGAVCPLQSEERHRHRPIRVLHVVERMGRGGIETWLMHVLRQANPEHVHMDFLVHSNRPGDYDPEILEAGSLIHQAAPLRNFRQFLRTTAGILGSAPGYDILHCHNGLFGGPTLKCAHRSKIGVRIIHSHNDQSRWLQNESWKKRFFVHWSRRLIGKYATHGLACGELAAESQFGVSWRRDPRWKILPYGIDLAPLAQPRSASGIRQEFGIPADAIVIGHVGRFQEQKNHAMIVRIAQSLARKSKRFHLVLVGDGHLRPAIEAEVIGLGLSRFVTFAGTSSDVPRLFSDLFDVFLLPSRFEGLPLVGIESLAAACPTVKTDVISTESDLFPELVTRLPLDAAPDDWADALLSRGQQPRTDASRAAALKAYVNSPFNIAQSVRNLTALYLRALNRDLSVPESPEFEAVPVSRSA